MNTVDAVQRMTPQTLPFPDGPEDTVYVLYVRHQQKKLKWWPDVTSTVEVSPDLYVPY